MNSTKKNSCTILAALEAVNAIFFILAVSKIAPVCTKMLELSSGKETHMKCYYTGIVLFFFALLFLINAISHFLSRQQVASGIMGIALAVFTFLALNSTVGIGVCMNAEMACNLTSSFAKVCGAIQLLLGAISIFVGMKEIKNK